MMFSYSLTYQLNTCRYLIQKLQLTKNKNTNANAFTSKVSLACAIKNATAIVMKIGMTDRREETNQYKKAANHML